MPPCCASKGRKESGGTDATHSEESQWNLKKQGPLYPNELLMVLNLNILPNHKWIHQDFVWIMILKKRGFMNPKVLIRLVLRLFLIEEESVVFFGKYNESASLPRRKILPWVSIRTSRWLNMFNIRSNKNPGEMCAKLIFKWPMIIQESCFFGIQMPVKSIQKQCWQCTTHFDWNVFANSCQKTSMCCLKHLYTAVTSCDVM